MSNPKPHSTSYADAGVNIDHGNALVERIKPAVARTKRPGVMGSVGGFGALFDIASLGYRQPVLVSGTDGVGTKIKLAIDARRYDTIGIDLVAMCVNDLLVQGAEPLFFLDYYASSRLDVEVAATVVEGIARGCELAGCALIGGETAEMPGMYREGDFDLAGFCVGVVERDAIIDGMGTNPGDIILGLSSSGPHSNGYSLVRKILADSGTQLDDRCGNASFADVLLTPTRIYIKPVLELLRHIPVKAIAHITGGGLLENIPRVLPDHTRAEIDCTGWSWPPIFNWLREQGNVAINEMYRTFNCGIGLVLVVAPDHADDAVTRLNSAGEECQIIGKVTACSESTPHVRLLNLPEPGNPAQG